MKNSLLKRVFATVSSVSLALSQCVTYTSYAVTNDVVQSEAGNTDSSKKEIYDLEQFLYIPEDMTKSTWYSPIQAQLAVIEGRSFTIDKTTLVEEALKRAGKYADKAQIAIDMLGDINYKVVKGDIIITGDVSNPDFNFFTEKAQEQINSAFDEMKQKYEDAKNEIAEKFPEIPPEEFETLEVSKEDLAERYGVSLEELEKYNFTKEDIAEKLGFEDVEAFEEQFGEVTTIDDVKVPTFTLNDDVDVSGTYTITIKASELDDNADGKMGIQFKYVTNKPVKIDGKDKTVFAIADMTDFALEKIKDIRESATRTIDEIPDEDAKADAKAQFEKMLDKAEKWINKAENNKKKALDKANSVSRSTTAYGSMAELLEKVSDFVENGRYSNKIDKIEDKLNINASVPSSVSAIMQKSITATVFDAIMNEVGKMATLYDVEITMQDIADFADNVDDNGLHDISASAGNGTYTLKGYFYDVEINDGSDKEMTASLEVGDIYNVDNDVAVVGLEIIRTTATTTSSSTTSTATTTATTTSGSGSTDSTTGSTTTASTEGSGSTDSTTGSTTTASTEGSGSTDSTTGSTTTASTEGSGSTDSTTGSTTTASTEGSGTGTTTTDTTDGSGTGTTTTDTTDGSGTGTTTTDTTDGSGTGTTTTDTTDGSGTGTTTTDTTDGSGTGTTTTDTTDGSGTGTTTTDTTDGSGTGTTTTDTTDGSGTGTTTTDTTDGSGTGTTTTDTTEGSGTGSTTTDTTDTTGTDTGTGTVTVTTNSNGQLVLNGVVKRWSVTVNMNTSPDAGYAFYYSHEDAFEKNQVSSIIMHVIYETDKTDDIKIDFDYASTPKETFTVGDLDFRYDVPLVYVGNQFIDEAGTIILTEGDRLKAEDDTDATVEVYIGYMGDVNLNYKVDAVDASIILDFYARLSSMRDDGTYPLASELLFTSPDNAGIVDKINGDVDSIYEHFAAFLGDVNQSNGVVTAATNREASKGVRMLDANDATAISICYAELSRNETPYELGDKALWDAYLAGEI